MRRDDGHTSPRSLWWWSELDQDGGGGIGLGDPGHSRAGGLHSLWMRSQPCVHVFVHRPPDPPGA